MDAVWRDLADPANVFAHMSYILLITSMLMTSIRNLRILALGSGIAAMAHFTFRTQDNASFAWELIFVLANGVQLLNLLYRSRESDLTAEERGLAVSAFGLEDRAARRNLLAVADWHSGAEGDILMLEGDRKPPLIYLFRGAAAVSHQGKLVAACGPGDFLGEMSYVSGAAASATVQLSTDARYAVLDRDGMDRLVSGSDAMRHAIDHALSSGLADKISRTNTMLATLSN